MNPVEKRHQNSIVARIIYDYPCHDRCFQNRDLFMRLCRRKSKISSIFGSTWTLAESASLRNYGLSVIVTSSDLGTWISNDDYLSVWWKRLCLNGSPRKIMCMHLRFYRSSSVECRIETFGTHIGESIAKKIDECKEKDFQKQLVRIYEKHRV